MVRDVLLSWFRHGSSWFVMFYSLKFSRKGSCDPLFSQSEFQIHYQISFLMRLLIFPFVFKEPTSKELCYKRNRRNLPFQVSFLTSGEGRGRDRSQRKACFAAGYCLDL